ncbi:hypothetical protein SeMB42_g07816 [Synchytrium endobioticum]|uniref:Uncharacterized protein n=1 Tax=Synchytrium endobioticum TaxID=286115 RepID=A0A507BL20_9FUNG|nr:hypothetical protein SeMB42_g07816 [Synchytrium endobioticum]
MINQIHQLRSNSLGEPYSVRKVPFPTDKPPTFNLANNNPGPRIYCDDEECFLWNQECTVSAMVKWNSPSGISNVLSAMMNWNAYFGIRNVSSGIFIN